MGQAYISSTRLSNRQWRLALIVLGVLLLILLCLLLWLIFRPMAPVADAGGPYTIGEGMPLTFDGSGSTGENITTYTWDFGDDEMGSGVSPSHIYSDGPAGFTVTLTVTDSQGRTSSDTTQVTVNNLPPIAMAGGPYEGPVGQPILLVGTCSDPSPVDAASCTGSWADFSGAMLSEANYTCPAPGVVTVTLTAFDKDGASAAESTTVTCNPIEDQPPWAVIKVSLRDKDGRTFGFSGSESTGQIVTYEWDFGDGTTDTTDTDVEVFHTYAASGDYIVTLTVTDDKGAKDASSVVIP